MDVKEFGTGLRVLKSHPFKILEVFSVSKKKGEEKKKKLIVIY